MSITEDNTLDKGQFFRRQLRPNSFMLPGKSLIEVSDTLEAQLNGEGGTIEQTALYIDPSSARRWYAIANQADYLGAHSGRPLDDVADHIRNFHLVPDGIQHLDLFGLGCGDGKNETVLAQHMLRRVPSLDLLLWDISQPLLDMAYAHARAVLGPAFQDHILTVPADFFQISSAPYVDLYRPQPLNTRRLLTLFGCTFGNLRSEISFVRNHLMGFARGDLLLVDVVRAFAPADQPDLVRRKDPRLSNQNSPGWDRAYEEFLSNTIFRYCRGVESIEFVQELDNSSCVVQGSYSVSISAKIKLYSGKEKKVTLMQYKRYDINLLVQRMEDEGWKGSTGWPYGQNRMLYLFEKGA